MEKKKKEKKNSQDNLISLADRSPEDRKRISQMGVMARQKKKEQEMALQKCMRQLLKMKPNSDKQKQVLRKFGFTDEELTNKQLLMVALFQKGLTGDVMAIKEVVDMMDKLDLFENTGKVTSNVTINLVSTGEQYQQTQQDEKEIWEVENSTDWIDEDDSEWDSENDWEDEIYNG